MPQEQFLSLEGDNSVALYFVKPPSPDFYAYLGMLLCFKAEKMREAAAATTGEKTNG